MSDQGNLRQVEYISVDELNRIVFAENAKRHAATLLANSTRKHGFNVFMGVGEFPENGKTERMLCAGHGRLEDIVAKFANNPNDAPDGVWNDNGVWKLPCVIIPFKSRNDAILFLLDDNRSSNVKIHEEDYDLTLLQTIAKKAQGGSPVPLPGFGAADFIGVSGNQRQVAFDMPEFKPFDATEIDGTPQAVVGSVTQTYTVILMANSWEDMSQIARVLTFGDRNGVPRDARMVSVEAMQYITRWANALGGNTGSDSTQPAEISVEDLLSGKPEKTKPARKKEQTDVLPEVKVPAKKKSANSPFVMGICKHCKGVKGDSPCQHCGDKDEMDWNAAQASAQITEEAF